MLTFDQSVDPLAGADAELDAHIIGNGAIIKVGAGVLTLTGANTFTGGTTIKAGTLELGTRPAAPTAAGIGAITSYSICSPTILALQAGAQPADTSAFANDAGAIDAPLDHRSRGEPLDIARGLRRSGIGDEHLPVLHQDVAEGGEPRLHVRPHASGERFSTPC